MKPTMRIIAIAAVVLPPVMAHADGARPISWWMAHPAEIQRVLPVCHDNAELANTATCENVEAASIGLRARERPDFSAMFSDTRYWSANPIARDAEISRCANGTSMLPQYCRFAAESALQEMKH